MLALARERTLLRARDLAERALPTVTLTRLVAAGKLERVARGLYAIPNQQRHEHHSLAEVSIRAPQGVICLLSALRVHEIGTQAPFEVWIAIPHGSPTPKIDNPGLRVFRMSEAPLHHGVTHIDIGGVRVPVFGPEKTVCDCFKFRNKIGLDVALEALQDGWAQGKFTMEALWHFAAVDRVTNIMRPYLESVSL